MKKVYYNKLIRDKIPQKILNKGSKLKTKKLNPKQFEKALRLKLAEEAGGVIAAKDKKEMAKELSDVLAVIYELQKTNKISSQDLKKAAAEEMKTKGGFKKRLFLFWSSKDDYKSNEKRNKK